MTTPPVKAPIRKTKTPTTAAEKSAASPTKAAARKKASPIKAAKSTHEIQSSLKQRIKESKAVVPAITAVDTALATPKKPKKIKFVRDSFTMPEAEYEILGLVKKACISAGIETKKSDLLRVALVLLESTKAAELHALIANLPPVQIGRPKKHK